MARILLADDDAILRGVLGEQLRCAGHDVVTASDGMDASRHLDNGAFDMIVCDVQMRGLDDMALLNRAAGISSAAEFVILTGHGSMENAIEAFKTGNVFDYLVKPLNDVNELAAVVERALERRRLRGENDRLVADLERRVQELEAAKRKLAGLADRDPLTGLYNHRAIHNFLHLACEVRRYEPTVVMAVDVDGFRSYNDAYGHVVGDQLLKYVGDVLRTTCGHDAEIGRCGGDEFLIVLPFATESDGLRMASRIRGAIARRPFVAPDGEALPVQLTLGVADSASAGSSAVALAAAADSALHEAKMDGPGTVGLGSRAHQNGQRCGRTAFSILDGLVTAIDHKDRYTRRHSEDVARYAVLLADTLGLTEETQGAVRVAGLLHDVGKIGIPDDILRKPGKLTDEEYTVMKNHVVISGLIIHGLPRLADVLDAVANHHERWDGAGYPRGILGADTPLLGRILKLADAFSAMTLDRPYRSGMGTEKALAEIVRCSGSEFDPDLAPVFIEAIRGLREVERPLLRAA